MAHAFVGVSQEHREARNLGRQASDYGARIRRTLSQIAANPDIKQVMVVRGYERSQFGGKGNFPRRNNERSSSRRGIQGNFRRR